MHFSLIFIIAVSGWVPAQSVNVPAPEYHTFGEKIVVPGTEHIHTPGAPNLPCKVVTIALPPGAIVEDVNFHGARHELGTFIIPPAKPPLTLTHENVNGSMLELYDRQKDKFYSSNKIYPETYGVLHSKGGLRKYTLVTVVCYHFAYNPVSKKLYCAPNINIRINYRMPPPESERANFWQGLKDDITSDDYAKRIIYNWQDAKAWYSTDTPKKANGYTIIIPSSLQNSVDSLVTYRQNQGYDVSVVTKEYIESNVPGDDLEQKIRNYLRANMADIEYVLLVGFITDTPWRLTVPFNNDPDGPYNDTLMCPIPSDLYYAELTDHDSLSWNSDGDQYYGEVFTDSLTPPGDDNPDYHADIHVGRIPISTQSLIEDICKKIIAFDSNTELSYKTASLLAGGIYYYENEDHSGWPRLDGADFMEQLMNDSILNRSDAVYLYEKAGLGPCPYPCTDSLTRGNQIAYWQRKGVMYETHHGNTTIYARKVWAWDDGDSVPEWNEIEWPTCLHINDVSQLDNDYPATTFLRSCLCGKPEVYGLGARLLHHGSSAVISSSRIAWYTSADPGGIPYHWYDYLLRDTTSSKGIMGDAYDMARNDLMDASGFWIIAYHYNLYGDPATKQLGRQVGVEEEVQRRKQSLSFSVYPNPTSRSVTIHVQSSIKRKVELDMFDASGRLVRRLFSGYFDSGTRKFTAKLPTGIYFLRFFDGSITEFKKLVIIE